MQAENLAKTVNSQVMAPNIEPPSTKNSVLDTVRFLCIAVTLLTGFSALVYEVTWHYYLGNLLGSQARSTAVILATFLGGLAIGYQVFGQVSRRWTSRGLVGACGLVEVGIGVWAFLFPFFYRQAWSLQLTLGDSSNLLTDILLAFCLIGPPTILMGGSLPLLTQGLSKNLAESGGFHARLYIANTLGAFLGTLAAGFFLIPSLGLSATLSRMGVLNVLAGAVLLCFSLAVPASRLADEDVLSPSFPNIRDPRVTIRLWFLCFFSFLGGFVSITVQTILTRVLGLAVGASPYTFSLVVSSFILVLALGAAFLSDRRKRPVSLMTNQLLISVGLLGLYYVIPLLPYSGHVLRTLLTNQAPNFWLYQGGIFIALCLLIAIPVGAMGANLPILFRESRDRPELLGGRVGLIYGVNAIGCLLGAIGGGYLALLWLNLDDLLVCAGTIAFAVVWIMALRSSSTRKIVFGFAALAGIFLFGMTNRWERMIMGKGLFNMTTATASTYKGPSTFYKEVLEDSSAMVAYKDDPNTTVGVLGYLERSLSIMINGKSDGNTGGSDRVTVKLLAHLPSLLQTSTSDRVAVIGFGTGITAGTLARYDFIKNIDLCEISVAVRRFSPLFDRFNESASKSPKITWRMGDAYRFLLQSNGNYALIVSEPSNPWVAGVERLYTAEFYEVTRKTLAPGGIFAQWFHGYSMAPETFALVLRTFKSSFEDVHLFGESGDVILIGSNEKLGKKNLDALRQRYGTDWIQNDLKQVGFGSAESLVTYENLIPWGALGNGELQTLDRPTLSHKAGKDRFLNLYSTVSEIAELPQYKRWSRQSFLETLRGREAPLPLLTGNLKERILSECSVQTPAFFQNWNRASYVCRASLVSAAVAKEISAEGAMSSNTLTALQQLVGKGDGSISTPTANEAGFTLQWVAEYGVPFLQIDPGLLRTFAQSCFKDRTQTGYRCRLQLVIALANSGYLAEAKEELNLVKRDANYTSGDAFVTLAETAVGIVK